MTKALYTKTYWNEAKGMWQCDIFDKKTNKLWSSACGEDRIKAVANARGMLPKTSSIKRAIGWVERHPFWGGFGAGVALSYWQAKEHNQNMTFGNHLRNGLLVGLAAWVAAKLFGFVFQKNEGDFESEVEEIKPAEDPPYDDSYDDNDDEGGDER